MHNINKSELINKVLINVLFISLFISIFFFTYGSYIEKKVINNQMYFLAENIKSLFSLFGENTNKLIIAKINEIELPNLSKEDKKVKENNNKIKIKAFLSIIIFIILISVIIYFNYNKFGNNSYKLSEIISENIIILIAIALTEFIFITYFGARFISIEPNIVKLTILKSLKEKEKEHKQMLIPIMFQKANS